MTWTLRRWQAEALPIVCEAIAGRKNPVVAAFMGAGKSVLIAEIVARSKIVNGRSAIVVAPRANLVRQLSETLRRRVGKSDVGEWYEDEKQPDRRVVVSTYQSLPTLVDAWRTSGRLASLLVCDEVHRTETPSVLEAVEKLRTLNPSGYLARVGFTATPFRAIKSERLTLWDEAVYRYTYEQGLADGVVVPIRAVTWDGAGYDETEVDDICIQMLRPYVSAGRILANANNIADAELFALTLTSAGIQAKSFHSKIPLSEQERRLHDLREGKLAVLVHVAMLAEGSDFPWLRTLLFRRKIRSRVRFVQECGRGSRADTGKTHCTLLDPFNLMAVHGLTHPEAFGYAINSGGASTGEHGAAGGQAEAARAVATMPVGEWLAQTCAALEPYGMFSGANRDDAEQPVTGRMLNTINSGFRFLRWLPHASARKQFRIWQERDQLKKLTMREASYLDSLLAFLEHTSKGARSYMADAIRSGDKGQHVFIQAQRLFQWPDVDLPTKTPSLGERD